MPTPFVFHGTNTKEVVVQVKKVERFLKGKVSRDKKGIFLSHFLVSQWP